MNPKENVIPMEDPRSVRDQAASWLIKLDADEPDDEILAGFKNWVKKDPAHQLEFRRLAERWGELNQLSQLVTPLEHQAVKKQSTLSAWLLPFRQMIREHSLVPLGASLLVVLSVAVVLLSDPAEEHYTTAIGEQKTLLLDDSSVVTLNTNSQLHVDYSAGRRGIYLISGEAHFDVSHHEQWPFEVYVGGSLVRAVGTAFSVHLRQEDVKVTVNEGLVVVDRQSPKQTEAPGDPALTLARSEEKAKEDVVQRQIGAGNQAVFDLHKPIELKSKTEVDVDRELAWRDGMLMFKQVTLAHMVAEINRYSTTRIVVNDDEAKKMQVGGLFKVGDTRAVLDALESRFGLVVERQGDGLVYLSLPNETSENEKQ